MVLETVRAIGAVRLQTAKRLSAYTDAVVDLDVLDVLSDLDGSADNLVTYAASFMLYQHEVRDLGDGSRGDKAMDIR